MVVEKHTRRRINRLRICLICAVLQLAVPQLALAETLSFWQSNGTVTLHAIRQSGSIDQKIGKIVAYFGPAQFSGNVPSLTFQQAENAASSFAVNVRVARPSGQSIDMASDGHLLAEVVAWQYMSTISTADADEKYLNIWVSAPDAVVTQDIVLSGGPIDLWVTQTNDASLHLEYAGLCSTMAEVQVWQNGFDTVADVTGSGEDGSVLIVNLQGDMTSVYVDASLGINSRLTYDLKDDGVSSGTVLNRSTITVPDNSAVTITGGQNLVTNDIEADSVTVDIATSGDDNVLATELTAPSVVVAVDIDGDSNTVTQTASAATSVYLQHVINGNSNRVEYNPQTDTNVVNSASVVSSSITLLGDTNSIKVRQRGSIGLVKGVLTMSGRDATITQTGANNSALLTVGAEGGGTVDNVNDYTITQSAAKSVIVDTIFLSAGASSSITVTN